MQGRGRRSATWRKSVRGRGHGPGPGVDLCPTSWSPKGPGAGDQRNEVWPQQREGVSLRLLKNVSSQTGEKLQSFWLDDPFKELKAHVAS